MTAVVQVSEQYVQQFRALIETLPRQAVKITVIKNDLDAEITKRVEEIRHNETTTKPLEELDSLRERYVQH